MSELEWKKVSAELLILSLVEARPRHGYEISKLIEQRSGGTVTFLAVHRAIVGCKDRMLSVIANKMNVLSEWMLLEPPMSNESQDTKTVDEQRQAYSRLFAEVKQMKEWPFDVMSAARIALSIGPHGYRHS